MNSSERKGSILIAAGRNPWPHELHAARILALSGYTVEFLPEGNSKNADIFLDSIEFEIKSPETAKALTVEQIIRKALKQSLNIIIDSSRMKMRDDKLRKLLMRKCSMQKQIKRMILITKNGKIIDIHSLV